VIAVARIGNLFMISICYFFSCKAIRNSISGFFVDRYDTIWYMRLWVDDFRPEDRGGVYYFGRLSHLGAVRVVSCGVIWDFVS
jgi:hypothetical protein